MRDTTDTVQALAHQEVEQEREVAIEVETVREVQKPHHATAAPILSLHKDVRQFVDTSRLAWESQGFHQAFAALRRTGIGRKHGINDDACTQSKLYITTAFTTTIVTPAMQPRDEYFRPISFFIWSEQAQAAMVISPHEAEQLLSIMRDASKPATHLIAYVPAVTKFQLAFNRTPLYSVPPMDAEWQMPQWLVRDLGILAGRLYFDDDEHAQICSFLGLATETKNESAALAIDECEMLEDMVPVQTAANEDRPTPDTFEEFTLMDQDIINKYQSISCQSAYEGFSFEELRMKSLSHQPGSVSQLRKRVQPEEKPLLPFTSHPLIFMQEWLAICRKGQDVSQTPMGFLCRGRKLDTDITDCLELVDNDQSAGLDVVADREKEEDADSEHDMLEEEFDDLSLQSKVGGEENVQPKIPGNDEDSVDVPSAKV